MYFVTLAFLLLIIGPSEGVRRYPVPSVQLQNAADSTLWMPVIGLGTGGYAAAKSPSASPEHWNVSEGFDNTLKWFSIGGVRWDTSNSYESHPGVAAGILNVTDNWTTTKREDIFITSKIGPSGHNLGYNETLSQIDDILNEFNTHYVDLLLIHWPSWNSTATYKSSDPYCHTDPQNERYSASKCRQSTWKAMELALQRGQVRAIGVSNFEKQHLEDILALNSEIPAVNQFEYVLYEFIII